MRRFLQVVHDDWPRLILELVILVIGISASFALEDWRQDRENRRVERQSWAAVRDDLAADTLYLALRVGQLRAFLRADDALLTGPAPDSVDAYMDRAISYVAFRRTDHAFQELRQTSNARALRHRALFNALSTMYARDYELVAEWDDINRDFVLRRMIPYLDTQGPRAYAAVRGGRSVIGLRGTWAALGARPAFRNLLATERLFVEAHLSTYEAALVRARTLMARVEREALAPARAG